MPHFLKQPYNGTTCSVVGAECAVFIPDDSILLKNYFRFIAISIVGIIPIRISMRNKQHFIFPIALNIKKFLQALSSEYCSRYCEKLFKYRIRIFKGHSQELHQHV